MITESFDNHSPAIINPQRADNAPKVDACILTFSHEIEKYVVENYECEEIAEFWFATGRTPVWQLKLGDRKIAFYKTYVGFDLTDEDIKSIFALQDGQTVADIFKK